MVRHCHLYMLQPLPIAFAGGELVSPINSYRILTVLPYLRIPLIVQS